MNAQIRFVADAVKVLGKDRIKLAIEELKTTKKQQCFGFMTVADKYCAYGLLCSHSTIFNHFNRPVFIARGSNCCLANLNDWYRFPFPQIALIFKAMLLGYTGVTYDTKTSIITGYITDSGSVNTPVS